MREELSVAALKNAAISEIGGGFARGGGGLETLSPAGSQND